MLPSQPLNRRCSALHFANPAEMTATPTLPTSFTSIINRTSAPVDPMSEEGGCEVSTRHGSDQMKDKVLSADKGTDNMCTTDGVNRYCTQVQQLRQEKLETEIPPIEAQLQGIVELPEAEETGVDPSTEKPNTATGPIVSENRHEDDTVAPNSFTRYQDV